MYERILDLTFYLVFKHKVALIKALAIPLLLIIILSKLSLMYSSMYVGLACLGMIFLINVNIAITTYRILLLGDNSVPTWGLFKISKREFSFLLNTFLLVLIMTPVIIAMAIPFALNLSSTIITVTTMVSVLTIFILFSRLSLVLPSIAIDNRITFKDAWDYTQNYKMLTFFSIIIFPAIITAVIGLIYKLIIMFLVTVVSTQMALLYPVLDLFLTVFVISALSATYSVIKEEHPAYLKDPSFIEENIKENKKSISNEIIITNNHEHIIINKDDSLIDFDQIKDELIEQYEELGFKDIVIDKKDTWMIMNPEIKNAHVAVTFKGNEYKIETVNVQEVDLDVFLFKNEEENKFVE